MRRLRVEGVAEKETGGVRMTTGAWIMLAVTWSVIFFFTGRFFVKVLTIPPDADDSYEYDSRDDENKH